MVISKKICLYTTFLGSIFCFDLRAATEEVSAKINKTPLEELSDSVKNDWYVNLLTRVAAKTALEVTAKSVEDAALFTNAKDIGKAIGAAALDELAPLPKDAKFEVKHADLLLPIVLSQALSGKNFDKKNGKELAIKIVKKELFKGFFINPDYSNLETLEDAAFFAADFGVEVALKDKDIETDFINGLKRAVSSKIISPIIMAYAGNDIALSLFKTENKNIQKQLSILFERLIVGKILSAALKIQE